MDFDGQPRLACNTEWCHNRDEIVGKIFILNNEYEENVIINNKTKTIKNTDLNKRNRGAFCIDKLLQQRLYIMRAKKVHMPNLVENQW